MIHYAVTMKIHPIESLAIGKREFSANIFMLLLRNHRLKATSLSSVQNDALFTMQFNSVLFI